MPTAPIFTARRDDIFAEDILDEVLVYDRGADTAHCLSEPAAVAWRTCDGGATLDEIANQLIARDLADAGAASAELADAAVAELIEKRLLDASGVDASAAISRRKALRRIGGIGVAAVVGPLIVSAGIPSVAAASTACKSPGSGPCTVSPNNCCTPSTYSCVSNKCCASTYGASCTNNNECCGNLSCPSGVCCYGGGKTPDNGCTNGATNSHCCSGVCQSDASGHCH
jgi:hypothetical protein